MTAPVPRVFTEQEVAFLCDTVADGGTVYSVAKSLGRSVSSVKARWRKIVQSMGEQAR